MLVQCLEAGETRRAEEPREIGARERVDAEQAIAQPHRRAVAGAVASADHRHGETPAGRQHAVDLGERARHVGEEVQRPAAVDHVEAGGGEGQIERRAAHQVEGGEPLRLPQAARVGNFEEVDLGYTAAAAVREAQRCLNCSGCAECERVCPMEIPLNLLNRKMAQELYELYGFEAGMQPQEQGALTSFQDNDDQSFIK